MCSMVPGDDDDGLDPIQELRDRLNAEARDEPEVLEIAGREFLFDPIGPNTWLATAQDSDSDACILDSSFELAEKRVRWIVNAIGVEFFL